MSIECKGCHRRVGWVDSETMLCAECRGEGSNADEVKKIIADQDEYWRKNGFRPAVFKQSVRKLRPWELEDIIPLAQAFHLAANLGGEFSEEVFINTVAKLGYEGRLGLFGIFDDEDDRLVGVLIGTIGQHFLTTASVAQELMWFVCGQYRGGTAPLRLVKEFEKWAKGLGAAAIIMASFNGTDGDDRLPAIYERLGYSLIEQHFFKPFT